jgi:ribosomal protein S6--L-glutamate ligase
MLILTDRPTKKMVADLKSINPLLDLMGENAFTYELGNFQSMEFFIAENDIRVFCEKKLLTDFDSVYIKRAGKYQPIATLIARYLQKRDIPFVDTHHVFGSINGKLAQTFVLAESGLPVPKTYFSPSYNKEKLLRAEEFLHFPIVAKKIISRQGKGVFLVRNRDELLALLDHSDREKLILQEFIPNQSDFRVFITGTIVGALEERTRQNTEDFRNNASLGGREVYSDPNKISPPLRDLALEAAKVLHIEVAGVDIVVSSQDKKMYLFEVNRSPGFTPEDPQSTEIVSLFNYLCQVRKSSSTSPKKK